MKKHVTLLLAVSLLLSTINWSCNRGSQAAFNSGDIPPNVIIIFTDDLGYGDLECYGNEKLHTPNINKLATEGCLFRHAYVPAAVCTPSRYGLLTGRYPWRTFLKKGVIADSPSLIDPDRYTMADLFKEAGYQTAAIGKWHLGFGDEEGEINYNEPVKPGPNELGFDYFFGLPVGHFYPPFVYMRNHEVVGLDSDDPIRIVREKGKAFQEGGEKARIDQGDVSKVIFKEAEMFVSKNKSRPFFLFLGVTKPHTPFEVHDDFKDSGPLSRYGDVIRETDYRVGQLMHVLDSLELTERTLVIFTSDNGGVSSQNGHMIKLGINYNTNYPLRGDKGDVWEGGVRIPFIIRYPEKVKAGITSDHAFCMTDLLASFSTMLEVEMPDSAGVDSYDVLPALLGEGQVPEHPFVLQGRAGTLALRWGEWKYIPDCGNGDWDGLGETIPDDAPSVQLYRITDDISEQHNLYQDFPEKVQEMDELLSKFRKQAGMDIW
jgi:arylsulfatase A